MVIKKTKKVLLGFVATSFILLVMVAPTTTAAASLQQQDDNATTIDEPNIPIGPADEGPDEPIPNNENGTDDDDLDCLVSAESDQDDPCAAFCGHGACETIETPETWINWVHTFRDGDNVPDGGKTKSHEFVIDFQSTATDTGRGSHVDLKIDNGGYRGVASPQEFTIDRNGHHTLYLKGIDRDGNEDPTPATYSFTIVKKDKGGGYPETWINSVRTPEGKNIPNGGSTSSKVVTVDFQGTVSGPGSEIDLKLDNRKWVPVASPKTIPGLSVGKHTIYLRAVDQDGNVDPTPAKWTLTVKKDKGGYPETWINWVRATPRGVNIANGGSTSSSTVIVDFQGTVAGKGSHIDLKIDSGSYVPVASPHKITGLSDGPHTIYLKAVNQAGKADPTPAKWRFTVINDDDRESSPPQETSKIHAQTHKSVEVV